MASLLNNLFFTNDKVQTAGGGGSWGNDPIIIPESTNNKLLRSAQDVSDKATNVTNNIIGSVSGPFDFISWASKNWQLVVVGIIALIVLIKD